MSDYINLGQYRNLPLYIDMYLIIYKLLMIFDSFLSIIATKILVVNSPFLKMFKITDLKSLLALFFLDL